MSGTVVVFVFCRNVLCDKKYPIIEQAYFQRKEETLKSETHSGSLGSALSDDIT